jgi:hypothetical protein
MRSTLTDANRARRAASMMAATWVSLCTRLIAR